jgi:hypothetical protein
MMRNVIDLVLLAFVLAGGVLAWQAGDERARLAAHHDRLVAAAGELPVDDPTLIYLKALDTGDPLHFAWRVHLPANSKLNVRSRTGSGSSGGAWLCLHPMDFIARVRFREDREGMVNVYTKFSPGSSQSGIGPPGLARLLRERARELNVEQAGKRGVAVLDPKATKPTVILRVALPESLRQKPPPDLPAQFVPNIVEMTVGPPGSLP